MIFTCTQEGCSASFFTKIELRAHLSSHEAREFGCAECGLSFRTRNCLQKHVRIHDASARYQCTHPFCGKVFTRKSNLTRHAKIHSGSKEYRCAFCNKTFTTRSNLTQHEQVHATDKKQKNYTCLVADCGAQFLYFSSLKKHTKSFHKNTFDALYSPGKKTTSSTPGKENNIFSFDISLAQGPVKTEGSEEEEPEVKMDGAAMDISFQGGSDSLRTVTEESFESGDGPIEIPDDTGFAGEDDPFAWLSRSYDIVLPEGREEKKEEVLEEEDDASPGKGRRGLKPYDDFELVKVEFAEPQIELTHGARNSMFWPSDRL